MKQKANIIAIHRGRPEKNRKDTVRVNNAITVNEVRVIDEKGEQLGIISTEDAMRRAMSADLDLVEVSPNAEPPVCKIIDYGKYKFQMQKKASEMRKNQVKTTLKEITIRPQTEEHDYQIKLKNIFKFIGKGDKVKVSLRFRGREITHKELGYEMLQRIAKDTEEIAKVDQAPKMEGRFMLLMLSPISNKKQPFGAKYLKPLFLQRFFCYKGS